MSIRVLMPTHLYKHHICAFCPQRLKESIGVHGHGITDGCEPLGGFWKLKPGPLPEQQVFLVTEPPL